MGKYRGLNSFDEVAKKYNETKPIRGRKEDVRPIAERRYAWNRIIKLSDNKYALSDGYWAWWEDGLVTEQTAPIVWERKEDGDYITVRSHKHGGSAVSRYQFINTYLPAGMSFSWGQSGKHFVHDHKKVTQYYLPKFKANIDYTTKTVVMLEDNKLVFKQTPEEMVRVGELVPMKTRRLDKDLDKEYDKKLRAMWEWMQVVLPILGETMYESKTTYADSFGGSYWYWTKRTTPEEVREILNDEEHPKRMAFAVLASIEVDAMRDKRFEPKGDSYKKLRTLVRRVGDFYKTELA